MCDSEYVAAIRRCPMCDVALVGEPIGRGDGTSAAESVVTVVEVWYRPATWTAPGRSCRPRHSPISHPKAEATFRATA